MKDNYFVFYFDHPAQVSSLVMRSNMLKQLLVVFEEYRLGLTENYSCSHNIYGIHRFVSTNCAKIEIKKTVSRVLRTKRSSDSLMIGLVCETRVTAILIFYICTIWISVLHVRITELLCIEHSRYSVKYYSYFHFLYRFVSVLLFQHHTSSL